MSKHVCLIEERLNFRWFTTSPRPHDLGARAKLFKRLSMRNKIACRRPWRPRRWFVRVCYEACYYITLWFYSQSWPVLQRRKTKPSWPRVFINKLTVSTRSKHSSTSRHPALDSHNKKFKPRFINYFWVRCMGKLCYICLWLIWSSGRQISLTDFWQYIVMRTTIDYSLGDFFCLLENVNNTSIGDFLGHLFPKPKTYHTLTGKQFIFFYIEHRQKYSKLHWSMFNPLIVPLYSQI